MGRSLELGWVLRVLKAIWLRRHYNRHLSYCNTLCAMGRLRSVVRKSMESSKQRKSFISAVDGSKGLSKSSKLTPRLEAPLLWLF